MKPGRLPGLARSLARAASEVLGNDSLHIAGGGGVDAIQGDIDRGEDFPDDVADPETAVSLVIVTEEFQAVYTAEPGTYVGSKAYYQGENYRITRVSHDAGFVVLSLKDEEEGA